MPLPSLAGTLGPKRAAHLLHRASFGPTKDEIDAFAGLTAAQAVSQLFPSSLPTPLAPKGSRYLGFSNPFEIANLVGTADGGLVVCGTTYVVGRFPRICLFKLSAENLDTSVR